MFSGLHNSMESLYRLSDAKTRSICAENPTGEKGKGGMATEGTGAKCAEGLGQKWKVSPSYLVAPGETLTLADIELDVEFDEYFKIYEKMVGKHIAKKNVKHRIS